MDENNGGSSELQRKLEANRRNAKQSTGPKSDEGKKRSRLNAIKHRILASALLITEGDGAEDTAAFSELLSALVQDRQPVGMLEEMLVEKIAVCWWRQRRALLCEAGTVRRAMNDTLKDKDLESMKHGAKLVTNKDHLSLPAHAELDRVLRYETSIQRQPTYAVNQLERLRRTRQGEHVPAPVALHVSSDQ